MPPFRIARALFSGCAPACAADHRDGLCPTGARLLPEPGNPVQLGAVSSPKAAVSAVAQGRCAGLPDRREWPVWTAAQMRAAVEYLLEAGPAVTESGSARRQQRVSAGLSARPRAAAVDVRTDRGPARWCRGSHPRKQDHDVEKRNSGRPEG